MDEVFKTSEDYSDYAFSNYGRMLNKRNGKFLKLSKDNCFTLFKNDKSNKRLGLLKLKQKYFPEPIILISQDEYFEDIPDYPNYKISNKGRIYNKETGLFLKFKLDKYGYYCIVLYFNNGNKNITVHKVVATTFIYNDDLINKTQIDHIDRNKLNNCVENLRWITPSNNRINTLQPNKHYKNIYKLKNGNNEYWRIIIDNKLCKYDKTFSCKEYTLEKVKEIRNKVYKEQGITVLD